MRQQMAIGADQFVFVSFTGPDPRHKKFPNARLPAQPHRVPATVPAIKVTDHRYPARIRCPDRKAGAGNALDRGRVRAQGLKRSQVLTLGKQPQIGIAQQQAEPVRIVDLIDDAIVPVDPQSIGKSMFANRQQGIKQTVRVNPVQPTNQATWLVTAVDDRDLVSTGEQRARPQSPLLIVVQTQQRKRVAVLSTD